MKKFTKGLDIVKSHYNYWYQVKGAVNDYVSPKKFLNLFDAIKDLDEKFRHKTAQDRKLSVTFYENEIQIMNSKIRFK